MNARHEAAIVATDAIVDQLRAEIIEALDVVLALEAQLADLADTRQSVGLGFMTPETRAAADRAAAADREAARGLTGQVTTLGLRWTRGTTPTSTGPHEAPVTMAATSASAEILFALQHHVRQLVQAAGVTPKQLRPLAALYADIERAETSWGLCQWPDGATELRRLAGNGLLDVPPTTDGGPHETARHLARLVEHCTSRRYLETIRRDLDHLEARAREVVDGPARSNHPEPCPWCGHHSLVIHHRLPGRDDAQVIRCDGTHRCVCDWEWCECQRDPKHRHEWVNSGRAAHTWRQLAYLQTTAKEQHAMETRARDALARIRDLHQPTWTEETGEESPAYIHVTGETVAIPADHECVDDWTSESGDVHVDGCHDWEGASFHALQVCTTCGTGGDGEPRTAVLWPCPTHQACDVDSPADANPTTTRGTRP